MRYICRRLTLLLVALALTGMSRIDAVQRLDASEQVASSVVSPTVLATWMVRNANSERPVLDLLILWRGTPGWFMKGSAANERSSGNLKGTTAVHIARGGLDLQVVFDARSMSVEVQDKQIRLGSNNVILVDGVDSDGQTTIRLAKVDATQLSGPRIKIQQVLRTSPDLVDFLRCDIQLSDPKAQELMRRVCGEVKGDSPAADDSEGVG
jgi:hypothetical protein